MDCPCSHKNGPQDRIGVFDSGVGGLAVLKELLRELPGERFFYFGDNAHNPYGMRTLENIRDLSVAIAGSLLRLPSKVIVVACNTASAAALAHLRQRFPGRLFVGMEPAVKPAALGSRTGRIGVLATPATFKGEPFRKLRDLFGDNAEIYSQPCPGLADAIEQRGPDHPRVNELLARFIGPLLPRKIDHLVLACTHYSLVAPAISRIAGEGVRIVDPGPAVARQVRRVLEQSSLLSTGGEGELTIRVSGDSGAFSRTASMFLETPVYVERAEFFRTPAASAKK